MLLKWCTKAMMYDIDGIFVLNEINPVIQQLLECSNVCDIQPTEELEVLVRARVQAVLHYSSGILLQLAQPREALQAIEALTKLRVIVAVSDFTLMKYNLKLMIGYYPLRDESLKIAFE